VEEVVEMAEDWRGKLEPAPAGVPPALRAGEAFVLADGRSFVLAPFNLAQLRGPAAESYARIVNIVERQVWGVASAIHLFRDDMIRLVWMSLSRNYRLEESCQVGDCGACTGCLLSLDLVKPILIYLAKVSNWRELLGEIGSVPTDPPPSDDGTSSTIN
jgi:hypothetical protein